MFEESSRLTGELASSLLYRLFVKLSEVSPKRVRLDVRSLSVNSSCFPVLHLVSVGDWDLSAKFVMSFRTGYDFVAVFTWERNKLLCVI